MLRVNREAFRLFGIRYEEARRLGLFLAAGLAGAGVVLAVVGFMFRSFPVSVGGLLLLGLAPVLYFYPVLELSSRFKRVESELLPVALYASLYATAERDMVEGVYALAKERHLAPNVSKFVENVERGRVQKLLGTPHEALADAAAALPEGRLRSVLLAFATARGVGVSQELQARDILKSVLFELKASYQRLSETMKMLGEVVLVFYGVLPLMMLIMTGIMYRPGSELMILAYVFLAIPLMGLALTFLVHNAHPKTPESFLPHYRKFMFTVPAGAAAGVATYFVLSQLLGRVAVSLPAGVADFAPVLQTGLAGAYAVALGLGVGAVVAMLPVALLYLKEWRRRWGVISALPFFTRDLAEMVKLGFAPSLALPRLAQRRSYGAYFDKFITAVGRRLVGGTFGDAVKKEAGGAPWIAAVVLTAVGEADRLGSKAEVFAEVADASRDIVDILKAARSALRGSVIFGLVTVVIISVLLGTVAKSLLIQVAAQSQFMRAAGEVPAAVSLVTLDKVPEILTYTFVGAVLNAVVLGILIGKISDDNFLASALYAAVAAGIATAAIAASIFL